MKRGIRFRLLSWLLLLLFSYNIVGCYLAFVAWKAWMQYQLVELAATLPDEQLVMFSLPSDTDASEICDHGRMYDVVRRSEHKGAMIAYCIRDIEEDALSKEINAQQGSKAHDDFGKAARALHKNNTGKYTVFQVLHLAVSLIRMPRLYGRHADEAHYSCIIPVQAPPPKS